MLAITVSGASGRLGGAADIPEYLGGSDAVCQIGTQYTVNGSLIVIDVNT